MTLPKKRSKPRRTTTPRCKTQRCNKPARIEGWCVSHAEREADRLFSLYVRKRDGKCMAAGMFGLGCQGSLQAAHIYSRRYHATRFDPWNVHALCQRHHLFVDTHQAEKETWVATLQDLDIMAPNVRNLAVKGLPRADAIETALAWLVNPKQESVA